MTFRRCTYEVLCESGSFGFCHLLHGVSFASLEQHADPPINAQLALEGGCRRSAKNNVGEMCHPNRGPCRASVGGPPLAASTQSYPWPTPIRHPELWYHGQLLDLRCAIGLVACNYAKEPVLPEDGTRRGNRLIGRRNVENGLERSRQPVPPDIRVDTPEMPHVVG